MPLSHISVCICTFKRAELLVKLLHTLESQESHGLFTFDVVVADNDCMRSAREVVARFSSLSSLSVTYCTEDEQNIARARNKALAHAKGDLVAFIDDDEFPEEDWLCELFKTRQSYQAEGVLGPVKPHFEHEPPSWVTKGKFFDRPTHPTGHKVAWPKARSGNVLFKRDILNGVETPFRLEFATAGEDVDFFRRMMEKGCSFVWCNEAAVRELVPPSRCTRRYLLRRALLRGSNFPKQPRDRVKNVMKSLIAVPSYTLALPILAFIGHHFFLTYLIKLLDHSSRLLAFVGVNLVTERET